MNTDTWSKGAPYVRTAENATETDRRLAQALEELLAHSHAEEDGDHSNRPILLEALTWVVITGVLWVAIAMLL